MSYSGAGAQRRLAIKSRHHFSRRQFGTTTLGYVTIDQSDQAQSFEHVLHEKQGADLPPEPDTRGIEASEGGGKLVELARHL